MKIREAGVTISAVAALALLGAWPVAAQRPAGRGFGPGGRGDLAGRVEQLLERGEALGLTEEQRGRLEALREEVAQANEGLDEDLETFRQRSRERREAYRAELEALRESRRETLEPLQGTLDEILTEEQRAQLREQALGRRGARGRRFGAGILSRPGPGRMPTASGLGRRPMRRAPLGGPGWGGRAPLGPRGFRGPGSPGGGSRGFRGYEPPPAPPEPGSGEPGVLPR